MIFIVMGKPTKKQIDQSNAASFEKAANAIETTANLYQSKGGLFYPIYIDKQGNDIQEVESDEYRAFCYDCADWATAHFRAERKAGKHSEIENLGGIELRRESCPESTDFVACGHCYEYIETSVLHTFSQEIDHWLSLDEDDFKRQINFPRDAWVMHELLTSQSAQQNHPDELLALAERIIKTKGV